MKNTQLNIAPLSMRSLFKAIAVVVVFAGIHANISFANNEVQGQAISIEWLELPNSGTGKTPRLYSLDDRLLLSWLGGGNANASLRFSEFQNNTWTPPRTIASGDNWLINEADYAQILPLSGQLYLAIWLGIASRINYDYYSNTSLSLDSGKSWRNTSFPAAIYDYGQHGFASASLQNGLIQVIWIAGVDGDGQLFRATLDLAGNWTEPVLMDDRVCSCCNTAVSNPAQGLTLACRERSQVEVRDIAIISDAGVNSVSRILHHDNWKISGCPRNGGALNATAQFSSTCGATGDEIRLTVSPSGIQTVEPRDVVVPFLVPDENELRANITASFCRFVYFFRSREDGEAWVSEHDGTFLLSLEEAFTVGQRINAVRYRETLEKAGTYP